MDFLSLTDTKWDEIFIPTLTIWEVFIRGTLTFWFCFLYIRFFRRGAGQLSISDLLLITLISDAAQNSMAGEYNTVTEGVILVGTLVFWDYAINWLGFRSVFFSKLSEPDPVLLIRNGVMMKQNMKKELMSAQELVAMLREQGVDQVSDVKSCYIEGSGNISVIKK